MKKTMLLLLTAAMISCTVPQTGWATAISNPGGLNSPVAPDNSLGPIKGGEGKQVEKRDPLNIAQGDIVIKKTGNYEISGKSTAYTVTVNPDLGIVNITLNNADIDVSSKMDACAFSIGNGTTVNLTVAGDNVLKSGNGCAGLQVPSDSALNITAESTGTIHSTGGSGSAGIGGGFYMGCHSGQVTVNGSTIYATGGLGGAGIGGGYNLSEFWSSGYGGRGAVAVNDGTIHATGGTYAADIGGGAGFTSGGDGTVTIRGGTIIAAGLGTGIGSGSTPSTGTVSSNTTVTVDGGSVNGAFTHTPKNSAGQLLYRTVISIDGIHAVTLVRSGASCSTDAEGKLYRWLPAKQAEQKSKDDPAKPTDTRSDNVSSEKAVAEATQASASAVTTVASDETEMIVYIEGKEYHGSGVVKRDGTGSWTVYLSKTPPSVAPSTPVLSGIQFKVGNEDFSAISAPITGAASSSETLPLHGWNGATLFVLTSTGTFPYTPETVVPGGGSALTPSSGGAAVSAGDQTPAERAQTHDQARESGKQLLLDLGVIKGTSPTAFQADNHLPLTRETGVTAMVREFGQESLALSLSTKEVEQILKSKFSDCDSISQWARKYVAFSVKKGIVQGRTGGTFDPLDNLKGKDLAMIVQNQLENRAVPYEMAMKSLAQKGAVSEAKGAEMADRAVLRGELFDIAANVLELENADGIPVINLLAQVGEAQRARVLQSGLLRTPSIATLQFSKTLRVKRGASLQLPQKVAVTFRDQRTGEMGVDWDPFKTDFVGNVKLEGTIKGTAYRVAIPVEIYEEPTPHSSSSSYTPPTPGPASIDTLIEKVEATGVHTLLITMKQGKLLNSVDSTKVKFNESDGGEIPALQVNGVVIAADKLSATLTLNADLKESAKADGEDGDVNATPVRTYFSASALSLANGTVSLALEANSGFTIGDKIPPTIQSVYAKGDTGADHNIIVVKFNEDVFENAGASAAGFTVTDITGDNTVLTAGTDYTTTAVGGNVEITVIKTGVRDHKCSVALADGSNIGDNADGTAAFKVGNNHPVAFASRNLLKADGATADGTVSVQDVYIMAYDNGSLADETDDRILLSLPDALTATTLDPGDITVEFDSASAGPLLFAADITLAKDGSDFTVSTADGKLVLTLTQAAQDKIDEAAEFDNGLFRVTIVPGAHTVTPGFDVATPSVIIFGLTNGTVIAAD